MSGNCAVLDSNIIILASKQELNVDDLIEKYDRFYVSIITYMEVSGFKNISEKEKVIIERFFKNVEIIDVGREIAKTVIDYKINQSKKIKLPDAIILATAKFVNGNLITRNINDFIDIDNSVKIETA
jgi:predicted nucleic acid-binding protein